MKKKEVYQIDNKTALENNKNDAEGPYYTNKGYEALQVNFVEIEFSCNCCNTFF